ncbi:MAG: hypothetical protein QGI10_00125 [Vicinamibacterales bacterium]|nr:hypothetical protein [Vicinamibacterales bacterium]MDP7477653.1 hypothetical protein [Vicinamibacterales bacterium]
MRHLTETQAVARIKGNRLVFRPRTKERFDTDVAQFKEGEHVTVSVQRKRAHRSLAANRYYWFVVNLIAESTGQGADELHEFFKKRYLSTITMVVNRTTGQVFEEVVPGSSRVLYVAEFYDFVEKVRLFASTDLGLLTPDPNPDYHYERREAVKALEASA